MKDDLFYFMIEERKKLIFACNFQQTVDKWVSNFEQSLKHIKEYDKSIQDFSRNDLVILDRIEKSP